MGEGREERVGVWVLASPPIVLVLVIEYESTVVLVLVVRA
jgi:hypothetical protein